MKITLTALRKKLISEKKGNIACLCKNNQVTSIKHGHDSFTKLKPMELI